MDIASETDFNESKPQFTKKHWPKKSSRFWKPDSNEPETLPMKERRFNKTKFFKTLMKLKTQYWFERTKNDQKRHRKKTDFAKLNFHAEHVFVFAFELSRRTAGVSGFWAGWDSVWGQKKPEARKLLLEAADSPPSTARCVRQKHIFSWHCC